MNIFYLFSNYGRHKNSGLAPKERSKIMFVYSKCDEKLVKTRNFDISTSIWSVQHPNGGLNIQQWLEQEIGFPLTIVPANTRLKY